MPEGHTIHRLARDHRSKFAGREVSVVSPQGRFVAADRLNGLVLDDVEAFGKHLLYRFAKEQWVHVHLGLFGTVRTSSAPELPARPTVRMRLANDAWYADLIGPTQCAVIDRDERRSLIARLGPDPLHKDSQPEDAFARVAVSRQSIAQLLMDQRVVAGVGNVYRAEVLFRAGLNPSLPGEELAPETWARLWSDLGKLMRAGVRANRIVTTVPEHRTRPTGSARADDATYVYGRAGEPCRVCGTPVNAAVLAGRRLYWCRRCQR